MLHHLAGFDEMPRREIYEPLSLAQPPGSIFAGVDVNIIEDEVGSGGKPDEMDRKSQQRHL